MPDRQLFGYLSVGIGFVAVYLLVWGIVDPPRAGRRADDNDPDLYYDECTSNMGWYLSLVVIELASLVSGVIIAWRIRNAPTQFNESRAVGTSLYAILFVAIIVLGAYIGVRDNPDLSYAVLSLGVLVCVGTMQTAVNGGKIHRFYLMKKSRTVSHGQSSCSERENERDGKVYKSIRRFKEVSKLIRNHNRSELANMVFDKNRHINRLEGCCLP